MTIPNSVTNIGESAFSDTPWLKNKQLENPLVIINNILNDGKYCSGNVTIPDSVTSITDGAFSFCKSLKSITISDSVTSIGDTAFWGCGSLKSITIPDSVTSIGIYAIPQNTIIHGKSGSFAEEYAKSYNIEFVAE
ncbi:leucine-rich repeat protein [Ruminococcus sp. zg-924]|nr:leucine-rich repeat protein [Ruminococcus sp. zg-924]MCQ4114199.1 leucine-rich repeat protein [Ruminococcus sp. zg-921]